MQVIDLYEYFPQSLSYTDGYKIELIQHPA
jgi:hypothetical protein